MKRYGNDDRLLAIEVMNKPSPGHKGQLGTMPFALSMFQTAKSLQGTVPLTLGSARIGTAKLFVPLGLDIIEFHDNLPHTPAELEDSIYASIAPTLRKYPIGTFFWCLMAKRAYLKGQRLKGR
ncbi:MAG: hypothetical protein V4555_05120 [Acidobacteriota bacterium]